MRLAPVMLGLALLVLGQWGCSPNAGRQTVINLSHLNHLYDQTTLADGSRTAIIYIYAEYPDYHPVAAKGEGFTCVDDIARAAVVYLRYGQYFNDPKALNQARQLIRTLLKMQADNGCFYNFIRQNGQIERQNRNSQPLPDWWTWRALWAFSEFGLRQAQQAPTLADSLRLACRRIVPHIRELSRRDGQWENYQGFKTPTWLPQKYGADQASIVLKSLVNMFVWSGDSTLRPLMHSLVKGLLAMQVRSPGSPVDGLFRSWKNFWHAYGNSQADALLDYFRISGDSLALKAALREIDRFYPSLLKQGFLHALTLSKKHGRVHIGQKIRFEQIAYDFRPMIWACLNAYHITRLEKYALLAGKIATWFGGENAAHRAMYDPQTGRCYDGISGPDKVNLNSGAESTIEALLSLMEVERNPIARQAIRF